MRPHDPRGRVQVADVALDRADAAVLAACRVMPVGLGQSRDLDGIAEPRTRAVRFDVADRRRVHARLVQRLADHLGLAAHTGRVEPCLVAAVVVHRDAADQAVDVVSGSDRLTGAFEDDHADTFTAGHAVGAVGERAAAPVAREVQARLVHVSQFPRGEQAGRADDRLVRIAYQESLTGDVHRAQRRGAVGAHRHAGATQAQLRGNHRGHRAALREQPGGVGLRALQDPWARRVRHQSREQGLVEVRARGRGDAGLGNVLRAVTGILQRLPGVLQQQARLWVHELGVAGEMSKNAASNSALPSTTDRCGTYPGRVISSSGTPSARSSSADHDVPPLRPSTSADQNSR